MKRNGFLRILLYVLFLSSCTYFLSTESSNSSAKMSSLRTKRPESTTVNSNYNNETKIMLRP